MHAYLNDLWDVCWLESRSRYDVLSDEYRSYPVADKEGYNEYAEMSVGEV